MKSTGFEASERHFYIDALRVIAVLLMFVFHVSMIFVAESGWHIKNTEQSSVLLEVNTFLSFFRMPLLFFVSGYISAMLLTRLSWKEFLSLRFQRLIIPLVVWTFILVAPQIYFERKLSGYDSSYLEFYKTFLQFEWYPTGNFHWLHLWFIPYLFVYNLLLIPVFL
ncbi:MAG: acyltransferase family protein, partial [Pseudomonadota bacterium]